MKHAIRILTLLLAMVMVLSLAACAGKPATPAETPDTEPAGTPGETPAETPDEEPTDEPSEPVDEPTEPAEEPTTEHQPWIQYIAADVCDTSNIHSLPIVTDGSTLEFWWPLFSAYVEYDMLSQDDYVMFRAMNERTGINVELDIPSDANTQFGLMMASGDIPDFIYGFSGYYNGGLDHAVEEDVAANLKDYEDIMPNLFTILRSNETFWKQANTDSGYIALVPSIQTNLEGNADKSWMGYVIREDWLNELGMETPTTYSELETLLRAMKDGGYCENPFLLHGMNGTFMLDFGSKFWGGYGVDSSWYQEDNVVKYGPLQDGYRDYIAMLNRWYEEGLMSDSFVNPWGDGGTLFVLATDPNYATNDSIGVFPVGYTTLESLYAVNKDNPNYALTGLPFLSVEKDAPIYIGRQADNVLSGNSGAIMVDGGDVELTCKWFNYLFSEDGMLLYNHGVEGETFNFNEDGKPEWILEKFLIDDPQWPFNNMLHVNIGFNEPGYHQFDREFVAYTDTIMDIYYTWNTSYDIQNNYPTAATLTAEEGEDYSRIMSDIETYLNENLIQFVLGNRDMSEWDDFRDTLANDLHLDEALEIKQDSLDRYNAR